MAGRGLAVERLKEFVARKTPGGVYTLESLMNVVETDDYLDLAEGVAALVHDGLLEQFVRVESPRDRGGIKDFPSIVDVPLQIFDWRTGTQLQLAPENLRIMYRLPSKVLGGERK
jgi:hypothetical protein